MKKNATLPSRSAYIPEHIAIVMDGNGRWGKAHGKDRSFGHRAGLKNLRKILRAAREQGVKAMTLYSFSTENWRRPASEVRFLMGLLAQFIDRDIRELKREQVRVRVIGNRKNLSSQLLQMVEKAEQATKDNDAFHLMVAFNYGGRDEIARAAQRLAKKVEAGELTADQIDETIFARHLDLPDLPPPSLFIRTGGDLRMSNFLLWQLAYAELYFTQTLWPDFSADELRKAIHAFQDRDRRFGALSENESELDGELALSAGDISNEILRRPDGQAECASALLPTKKESA